MPTLRAILTGIRGVHSDILPTGPCCLVRKERYELTPRGVINAFGETMVVRHPVDRQVFDRNEIRAVDDTAAVLVGKVTASPRDTLMHASYDLTLPGALRRAFLRRAETALNLGKRFFLSTEEARVGNLLTSAEGGKRFQSYVYANVLSGFWQRAWLGALTGEADVPFAGTAAIDSGRLGDTFQGAMQDKFHQSYAMQPHAPCGCVQCAADRHLRIRDALIAALARKRG